MHGSQKQIFGRPDTCPRTAMLDSHGFHETFKLLSYSCGTAHQLVAACRPGDGLPTNSLYITAHWDALGVHVHLLFKTAIIQVLKNAVTNVRRQLPTPDTFFYKMGQTASLFQWWQGPINTNTVGQTSDTVVWRMSVKRFFVFFCFRFVFVLFSFF